MNIIKDITTLIKKEPDAASTSAQAAPPKKKVLIVEDEKMLAEALSIKLTHAGFEVLRAENGEVGLQMAKDQKPNIILLDIMMPVMDGKAMLQQLRLVPEFKTLPVVVLTNSGNVENQQETKTYFNASEFLIKSNVSLDEIVQKIKDLTTSSFPSPQ